MQRGDFRNKKNLGKALKDAAVSRAVDLSAEKYCSVALMLEKAVNITHSYEVIEA